MANGTERTTRRGMSLPFLLTLLLFIAVLADRLLGEPGFIPSAAWRAHPYIMTGTVVVGFLLWFWVLMAARRRAVNFEGPVQTVRGTNGAWQPILATIFIVLGVNLAYSHTLPKWLNFLFAEDVVTEGFTVSGVVAEAKHGCGKATASHPGFGDVQLCLPLELEDAVRANPGATVAVTGSASWFGLEPRRYTLADGTIVPVEDIAADTVEVDDGPADTTDDGPMPAAEELLDAITGAGEERRSTDKTGRAQRGALP